MSKHKEFRNEVVKAAVKGMKNNEGDSFGCIIVKKCIEKEDKTEY